MDPERIGNPFAPSQENFSLCKTWLNECYTEHYQCRTENSTFVPSRLLRLSLSDPDAPVLLINTAGNKLEWAALSYVWGGDQPVKLTKSSV